MRVFMACVQHSLNVRTHIGQQALRRQAGIDDCCRTSVGVELWPTAASISTIACKYRYCI